MNKTIYKLHEVSVKDYTRKDNKLLLKVRFSKNEVLNEFIEPYGITSSVELVKSIIFKIKSMDKVIVETESDDLLDNIYIIRLHNEEEVEERMLEFFRKLLDKVKGLKHETIASRYLNTIDNIRHQKLTL